MHTLIDGTWRAGRAVARALAVPVAIVAVANLASCAKNEGTPKAATENAGELIKALSQKYNRARQAKITKEISELIAGAEALK